MKRTLCIFVHTALAVMLCTPSVTRVDAQAASAPHKLMLHADLKPGDVLRYELEAAGSFVPVADASGAILTPPRGLCEYALAAIVTLRPQDPDKDATIPSQPPYTETPAP